MKSLLMTPANARAVRRDVDPKTQTRRLTGLDEINASPDEWIHEGVIVAATPADADNIGKYCFFSRDRGEGAYIKCPYGIPGQILAIKEATWMWCERIPDGLTKIGRQKWRFVPVRETLVYYCADHPDKPGIGVVSPVTGNEFGWRYKSARYMPAWAARTWVKLEEVRVQRVQEISREDAIAEGLLSDEFPIGGEHVKKYGLEGWQHRHWRISPVDAFRALWQEINAERGHGWDKNDWCWCLTFRRIEGEGREGC